MHETIILTFAEVVRLCRSGTLITRGPLNDTYRVEVGRTPLFVRQRVLRDSAYGQTFAAEEYLPQSILRRMRIPYLHGVLTDPIGQRTYALFEFVVGDQPDWGRADVLNDVAANLERIHAISGNAFGDICGPFKDGNAADYLYGLLDIEVSRLKTPHSKPPSFAESPMMLAQLFEVFSSEQPCLCHGDIHSGNFLRDAEGRIWTLDWEAARFRVAAADFNQIQTGWLSRNQQLQLVARYCHLTGRNIENFYTQVRLLQLLWHVRTYNFEILVRNMPPERYGHHIMEASEIFSLLTAPRRDKAARERQQEQ
jgi:hypothetical protein